MSEVILELKGVYKNYWQSQPLFVSNSRSFPTDVETDKFALKNINFSLQRGECLGVIGRNGSGKSTLLKVISRHLTPTFGDLMGTVNIRAIIELGTGMDHNQSGFQNAKFFLQMQGVGRENIGPKTQEIKEFSELGESFYNPVKTYSSGMSVRLAYAMHALLDSDILIVDEALAVGDVRFQHKCFNHVSSLRGLGTSIILVSHSLEQIRQMCDRVVVLDRGEIVFNGPVNEGCDLYLLSLYDRNVLNDPPEFEKKPSETAPHTLAGTSYIPQIMGLEEHPLLFSLAARYGIETGTLLSVGISANGHPVLGQIDEGFGSFSIDLLGVTARNLRELTFGFSIKTKEGTILYGTNNFIDLKPITFSQRSGNFHLKMSVEDLPLKAGSYFIDIGVCANDGTTGGNPLDVIPSVLMLQVGGNRKHINDGYLFLDVDYRPQ